MPRQVKPRTPKARDPLVLKQKGCPAAPVDAPAIHSKPLRILSIDVAIRTLAICVLRVPESGVACECGGCHPSWAGMTIEHWGTTDILKMHGCKARKITSVPCERLMTYMLNFFHTLLEKLGGSFTHILIERQHAQNKLSRYMSMCMYTFFYGWCGYRLEPRGKSLRVVRPPGAPLLQYVHAKHKLRVLPLVDEDDIEKTAKMTPYDVNKALAVAKVEWLMDHYFKWQPDSFAEAHQFWTGITTKDHLDDPADALLMALHIVEKSAG